MPAEPAPPRSTRRLRSFWLVAACVSLLLLGQVPAAAAPPAIGTSPVLAGLSSPVLLTSAKDGTNRLFVIEQGGVIKVVQPGASTGTNFLDITSRVISGGERGLLGLAFHPAFTTNRQFFVNYTRQPDGATVVSRFTVSSDPNVADAASEQVLFTVAQPFANHNGGMLAFGPDGQLYIGMGDGGSANDPGDRAQNPNELLGKMLRLDVNAAGSTPQIHALGFRNPWRFSFDRADGRLIVGDVGQSAREEIDIVTPGGNYGWRAFEGTMCTGLDPAKCTDASPYTMPIAEYSHTGGRCSITGGYSYRGTGGAMPAGTYVFGDYCTGEIMVLDAGQPAVALDTGMLISSFGEDESGEVYVVDHQGSVHRIRSAAPPPACVFDPLGSPLRDLLCR